MLRKLSKWGVTFEEYPFEKYPGYCFGPMYFISKALLETVVEQCPYHCTGQTITNIYRASGCFWKFEDVLLGSCILHVRRNTKIIKYRKFEDYLFLFRHPIVYLLYPNAIMAHPVRTDEVFLLTYSFTKSEQLSELISYYTTEVSKIEGFSRSQR